MLGYSKKKSSSAKVWNFCERYLESPREVQETDALYSYASWIVNFPSGPLIFFSMKCPVFVWEWSDDLFGPPVDSCSCQRLMFFLLPDLEIFPHFIVKASSNEMGKISAFSEWNISDILCQKYSNPEYRITKNRKVIQIFMIIYKKKKKNIFKTANWNLKKADWKIFISIPCFNILNLLHSSKAQKRSIQWLHLQEMEKNIFSFSF